MNVDFAERFRDLRVKAGLTKTAAAKPRYSVSYVSQIEAGRRNPSPEAMAYFAGRLGVTSEFLQTGVPEASRTTFATAWRRQAGRFATATLRRPSACSCR